MKNIQIQVSFLSGSTLAWCIRDMGYTGTTITYAMIDSFQLSLINYGKKNNWRFNRWQDLYTSYKRTASKVG